MTIAEQLRALAAQLETTPAPAKRELLPHKDDAIASMKLTEDKTHFVEPFWMEGYVGALPGVRLTDWYSEQVSGMMVFSNTPQHFRVLVPNAGQVHVSPADIGWMDSSWYDPDNYADDDSRLAAYLKAGRPTVGPRGKFGHLGRYMEPNPHAIVG